jgi:hypothetical protein
MLCPADLQRVVAFAYDDVAGCTGADFVAGMVDVDVMIQQIVADGNTFLRLEGDTFRT